MVDVLSTKKRSTTKRKAKLDGSSRGGGGGGGNYFSLRRLMNRALMIVIGLMVGCTYVYTNHMMKLINNNVIGDDDVEKTLRSSYEKNDIGNDIRGLVTDNDKDNDKDNKERILIKNEETKPAEEEKLKQKTEPIVKENIAAKKVEPKLKEKSVKTGTDQSINGQETAGKQTQTEPVAEDDRLNIVLFYADDWTMKVMGKLNSHVKTPNIDKMADRGMLFLNNCVTTSVCWISRATLVTGTYYSRHKQGLPFQDSVFRTHNWTETLFPKLKNSGYYTGLFGKWHLPSPAKPMKEAFDSKIFYYGHHWMSDFTPHGSNKKEHVTECNRRHSIEFLENRPKDKKFALKVSFFATHAVDNEQPSYQPMNWSRRNYYPDDETHENYTAMVPPETATERHWKELPYFFTDHNCGRLRWKNRWEPHCWQKNIRDLYALATEVDWAVGEIIDVLKKQGVYNETLLIFTTDNGDLHGQHGLAEKWYPFEESMRVPLVIQDPRMPTKLHGSTNNEWTLNVDLTPTLLRAAGLEASSFMQGRDIAELYLTGDEVSVEGNEATEKKWVTNIRRYASYDTAKPWRKEWFYEWNLGNVKTALGHSQDGFIDAAFALITNEWKYIYWPLKDYEQLYHRSLDHNDEYDILQNYYLHQVMVQNNKWIEQKERLRMSTFTPYNATPYGDSVQSTKEVYDSMKARFFELKEHVQSGKKI